VRDVTLSPADPPSSPRCWASSASGWPATPRRLHASLGRFVGHPAFTTRHLSADLDRFIFLLGGSGEELLAGSGDEPAT